MKFESETERKYFMLVSDFALRTAYLMLDNSPDCCDDDIIMTKLYHYFKHTYEQETDVGTDYCKDEEVLQFVSKCLSNNFLSNLELNQEYSTGFQVIMKIDGLVTDEESKEIIMFLASDNEEELDYWITKEEVQKNFEYQLRKDRFKYFPILMK